MPGIENVRTFCSKKSKRSQQQCRGMAVRGTVPPRCRHHLGTKVIDQRNKETAVVLATRADRFAESVPITAADSLLADIARSNGLILYYEGLLRQHEDSVIRSQLNAERAHSHKLTTTALAQKADERRALIFESTCDHLAAIIEKIVRDLGHDPQNARVRELIAERIRDVVMTTPDAPYEGEVVDPLEAEFDEWYAARNGAPPGPLSALEWDGEITDAVIVSEQTTAPVVSAPRQRKIAEV